MAEKKTVELLVGGGQANAGPPLGPALGPLGVNVMMIVNRINELTKDYAGMRVPVKVIVDQGTKEFEVVVGTPTTAALIASELKIEKGSATPHSAKVGNLNLDQILRIARMKQIELLARDVKHAATEVLGTCVSMGVTVEGKDPRELQKEINEGKHDEIFSKG